nr:hypothetical protein [Pantoea sp. 201603H]
MNKGMLSGWLWLTSCMLVSQGVYAADKCAASGQAINDSNSVIMLGGTAKGRIKQFAVGEFGKDVDQQKRILGQFDQCGVLTVADISYRKDEGNVLLQMEQHIGRVTDGWQAEYGISVVVKQQDQPVEVTNKRGTINYKVGKNGNITSATDVFILTGEKGFTETTYAYNKQFRLLKRVARGSDPLSNGESRFQWSPTGDVLTLTSEKSKETYTYDAKNREIRLDTITQTPASTITSINECQSWDETGNCTLSYSRETETIGKSVIKRNISAAYQFQYWADEKTR